MYVPRLKQKYRDEVLPALLEKYQYKSVMQAPKLKKITLNRGIGEATSDKKLVDVGVEELTQIAGQKAVPTMAKRSVSNFKLREGMPIGAKVTLRGNRMYEFLDRLIQISLPRVRDFQGVPDKAFDGRGNYNLGIREQIIFPEIQMDKVNKITGINITFVIDSQSDEESYELLKGFGMPFKSTNKQEN